MSAAETFALLEAAQSGDEEAGERVLREEIRPDLERRAPRQDGRGVETEGRLYQLGCIGFLKAVKGFEPLHMERSFPPTPYRRSRERYGDSSRDDGAIKVSRTLRERYAEHL